MVATFNILIQINSFISLTFYNFKNIITLWMLTINKKLLHYDISSYKSCKNLLNP